MQNIPYCHHVNVEGVAEGSILLKQCNGCRRLAWKGNTILEDWCTSNCLGVQRGIVLQRVIIFVPRNDILTGYIDSRICKSLMKRQLIELGYELLTNK
jgi:hypothetical protein